MAYKAAKDYDSVIRINLDNLQDPEEAVKVVNETKSVEGAKMVAKFFQKIGDFSSAIQFLVLSRCNDDAFLLAQEQNQMEQYAEIIGEHAISEDYNSIALFFENKNQHFLAGKFFYLAGGYFFVVIIHLVQSSNVKVQSLSVRVQSLNVIVQSSNVKVQGSSVKAWSLNVRVQSLNVRVQR